MSRDLITLLGTLGSPHVLVLGDIILDRYTWGDAERVSQEAPVILLRADRREQRLGGAANVCHMLQGLGARPSLAGVVGDDADGDQVRDELRRSGVSCSTVLTDATRPTTVKERFMGRAQQRHPHQMLRVDTEVREPLEQAVESKLLAVVADILPQQDIVLISDYGKGVCTERLLAEVIRMARAAGKRVLVDPLRGTDYTRYRGASSMTPNRLEASLATGGRIISPEDALPLATQLCRDLSLEAAIITLDRDGMALGYSDGRSRLVPTRTRQVYDITGAGDMVLAMIGMCLAAGSSYEDATRLANIAGGLEVEKVGVAIVTREEILADLGGRRRLAADKVLSLEALEQAVQARRIRGERIVFTNGCFDILHAGHVTYLEDAATHGDCLIVAINSDASVQRIKGPTRPIVPQEQRAAILAALEVVDFVTVFDQATPHQLLESLRPDVLIKGGTYRVDQVVGREVVEAYGGRVLVASVMDGLSSSGVIERILARQSSQAEGAASGTPEASHKQAA